MPAFTLEGFESPEEVQARIGKAKESAFAPQGDINQMIYQTAAQGEAGLGDALATGLGYEDPAVKKAKEIQEMMKDLDPTTSEGLYSGARRLFERGMVAEGSAAAAKALETRKAEDAAKRKAGSGRGGYTTLQDVQLPDEKGVMQTYKVPFDHRTGQYKWDEKILPSPKGAPAKRLVAKSVAEGKLEGVSETEARISLPKVQGDAEYLKKSLDELVTHKGFKTSVGAGLGFMTKFVPASDAADWQARFKQIEGKKFMEAYQSLKGGGQITEIEGVKATEAASRMKAATSEDDFISAVNDYKAEIDRAVEIVERRSGMTPKEVKVDQKISEAQVVLEKARAAIARGANKAKVIKKLTDGFKKKGYDLNLIGGL